MGSPSSYLEKLKVQSSCFGLYLLRFGVDNGAIHSAQASLHVVRSKIQNQKAGKMGDCVGSRGTPAQHTNLHLQHGVAQPHFH